MKTCLIRTDASISIGTGHVMRCLTLARHLSRHDYVIVFFCVDYPGHMVRQIEAAGFECRLLAVEEVIDPFAFQSVMPWEKSDLLIVDHYQIDAAWELAVKHRFNYIMAIDDLANRTHHVDLLLDQNLGREAGDYQDKLLQSTQCLIGPEFALLRDEFALHREQSLNRRKSPGLRRVLISMGGVDQFNVSAVALDAVLNTKRLDLQHVDVVVGSNFPHLKDLQAKCSQYSDVVSLHVGVGNMAELMKAADLAIGAAGGSAWERCALGLPSIVIVVADNQLSGAFALERSGAAFVVSQSDQLPQQLPALLLKCMTSSVLNGLSTKAKSLVDALGVERVVQTIMKQGVLRLMQPHDLQEVLEWRNHPQVRQQMFNQHLISFEEHKQWFVRAKTNTNKVLLVYQIAGQLQGFVQFDIEPDCECATWGFYKNPRAAAGVGGLLCQAALNYAFKSILLKTVKASVLSSNLVSIRFHRRLGFIETDSSDNACNFVIHRSNLREQEGIQA